MSLCSGFTGRTSLAMSTKKTQRSVVLYGTAVVLSSPRGGQNKASKEEGGARAVDG
jgi:hypothetical protein